MNLPKQCKPDSCVAKYPSDDVFCETYVDIDGEGGGSVYASDKSCAVRVPLGNVAPEDTSGPVSVAAWKMARKVSKFQVPGTGMILEPDQCRFVDGSTVQRPILGEHEAWPIKTVREIIDYSVDTKPAVCRVAIDVTLLKRIADGLGTTSVDLILHRPTAGLRVTKSIGVIPVEGSVPDARGAIMPCNGAGVGK